MKKQIVILIFIIGLSYFLFGCNRIYQDERMLVININMSNTPHKSIYVCSRVKQGYNNTDWFGCHRFEDMSGKYAIGDTLYICKR